MITANWHTPQTEARNPHSLVAIFQIQPKFRPKLAQDLHKIAETLTGRGLRLCGHRNYSAPRIWPNSPNWHKGRGLTGISRQVRYPWGCSEARMGDLPCNGAKPVHWNIFRGMLVLPPPPPPSNGQIYENKIKIPPMRNKYTVSFGVRLSKAEFVELENAIAAYPGLHRNLVASTAISRFVRSGGVEQLAQSIEPQTKTPA